MMNQMMQETLASGTATQGEARGFPAAGKTGTSQDFRDAWFVGYTGHLVTGVWLGNDDNSPTKKMTGGGLPVEVWSRFMKAAHQGLPMADLPGMAGRSYEPAPQPAPAPVIAPQNPLTSMLAPAQGPAPFSREDDMRPLIPATPPRPPVAVAPPAPPALAPARATPPRPPQVAAAPSAPPRPAPAPAPRVAPPPRSPRCAAAARPADADRQCPAAARRRRRRRAAPAADRRERRLGRRKFLQQSVRAAVRTAFHPHTPSAKVERPSVSPNRR